MIEHNRLMKYATEADENPIWFCLCKNDIKIDWKENHPDEILSVPETLFNKVGKLFIDSICSKNFGTVKIDKDTEKLIHQSFIIADNTEKNQITIREITKFIEKGKILNKTHYLTYNGS